MRTDYAVWVGTGADRPALATSHLFQNQFLVQFDFIYGSSKSSFFAPKSL